MCFKGKKGAGVQWCQVGTQDSIQDDEQCLDKLTLSDYVAFGQAPDLDRLSQIRQKRITAFSSFLEVPLAFYL
jgi:hypothetical protein